MPLAPSPTSPPPKVRFAPRGAFSRELERRVDAYFDETGLRRRDLPAMYVKAAVILAWFWGSWAALVFGAHTLWQATLAAISLGCAIAGVGMNIQHDANHGALSSSTRVNHALRLTLDLMGVNSFIWRQKHNILHHTYTNIEGVDFDLDFGFIARLSPQQRRRAGHRFQHVYLWFLYGFLLPKWVLIDDWGHLFTHRAGAHRIARLPRGDQAMFVAGKLVFLAWALVVPLFFHPLRQVLPFLGLAVFTMGVVLSSVFQLAHCIEEAEFPLPPPADETLPHDVLVHQVETSVDFARGNALATWYFGGLNYQVEHHLFPKICHLHYPALSRIVEQVAEEHGVRYRSLGTVGEALGSHVRLLRRLGRPIVETEATVAPALSA